jgi:23S rRNA U2552 (ribose-2'-O)-methylase RlmE/FtsJ
MDKFLIIDGIIAAQTPKVVDVFSSILDDFDIIIEIGFHRGGFTLWLDRNKRNDTKLISYDINFNSKEVNNHIDFRKGNCFDTNILNEIIELIQNNGKALILCDGGDKDVEFNTYSKYLKSGDVIMCHDYADSIGDYQKITSDINWTTKYESSFDKIKESVKLYELEKYHYNEFKSVLWGSFIKK